MNNIGRFQSGTIFVGNNNQARMKVLGIQKENFNGCHRETAFTKDLTTGKKISYGLGALERCSLTILEGGYDSMVEQELDFKEAGN